MTQLAPTRPVYNEVVSFRKRGQLDPGALQQAFNAILGRHDAWRTTFTVRDGEAAQVVHRFQPVDVPMVDLSHLPPAAAEHEAVALVSDEAKALYDLEAGPLLRPRLIRFAEDHHRLYLSLHHLVFDGSSLYRVVLPELAALCESFENGRDPQLVEPCVSYRDYSLWSRDWCTGPGAAVRTEYWRHHLAQVAALALPLDRARPVVRSFSGRTIGRSIPKPCADRLRQVAQLSRTTLFQVLAAAFANLLHRYSGQDDVVFATAGHLRPRTEFESLVGFMVTPLVLRCDLAGDPSFAELLVRVRGEVIDAMDNLVPLGVVGREMQPNRTADGNPLFRAMMVLEPKMLTHDPSWSLHREIEIDGAIGNAKFDLELGLDERPDGQIGVRLVYDVEIFDTGTAQQMADHWLRLLWSIAENPSLPISALRLLSDQERHRQLVDWNRTEADYPRSACVHDLVSAHAVSRPDAVAASFGDATLTYRELDQRANALAHRLRARGAGPGCVVGICVDRSLEMVIGLLGILKCGAAYLPLDPSHPPDRLAFISHDARATVVLGEPASAGWVAQGPNGIAFMELGDVTEQASEGPLSGGTPHDLMYVLYTSGSTGRPKGVLVRHCSVVNLLTSMAREPGLTQHDRGAALATITFDMATSDLWLPLVAGARIAIGSRQIARDGGLLKRFIGDAGVTFMQATPTSWQMLLDAGWEGDSRLVAVSAGEPLIPALAEQLAVRCREVWNAYGPTETTVWSTVGRVVAGERVTIGRPIANTRIYILDRQLQSVPVGVAGEIVIGGDGVANGYLNRPEETNARFIPDPNVPGGRAFRTGDLARFLPDGRIEYLGRLDDQIKLRGYRIDPGEIESILVSHPEVDSAAVIACDIPEIGRSLVAYVVPRTSVLAVSELRDMLRARLPRFMLPARFVGMDDLPLTSSGKVDRLSLPLPEVDELPRPPTMTEPPSELEERLLSVWKRVLAIRDLTAEDDFFEVGGHSLLAARLVAQVEGDLGTTLSLVTLFECGSTVRGMARAIEARANSVGSVPSMPDDDAITIRSRPRLFSIFPNEINVFSLRHTDSPLTDLVDVFPVLAARLGQRFDGSVSVDGMVASAVQEIRGLQESGPYFLAGWSLGGVVAYEVAGQLQGSGESVAWLGLVDAPVPTELPKDTVARQFARFRRHGPGRAGALVRYLGYWVDATRIRLGLFSGDIFDARSADRILLAHALTPNDVPLNLFLTGSTAEAFGPTGGWETIHPGTLRVHDLPGDHLSIFRPPHAAVLITALTTSISETSRRVDR